MNGAELAIAGWIIGGVATVVHTVVVFIAAAYPMTTLNLVSPIDSPAKAGSVSNGTRLSAGGSLVARSIAYVSLVVALVGFTLAIATIALNWWLMLVIIPAVIAGKLLIYFCTALMVRKQLNLLRRITIPLARCINRLALALRVERLLESTALLPGKNVRYSMEALELIKTSLPYLERVNIPVEERELRMIRGVLRMDQLKVKEIMCPLPDIHSISTGESVANAIATMRENGHSKLPVYSQSLDNANNVKGILFALDVLGLDNPDDADLQSLTRTPLFVTEFRSVEDLLQDFKTHRTSIALAVDEHGSISGLVTVNDILEEIVGELEDEFDYELPEVQLLSTSPQEAIVDARITIDQLNQAMNTSLKQPEDVDTVGGLVYNRLGRIPHKGDQVELSPLKIVVRSMVGRRIRRLHIVNRTG